MPHAHHRLLICAKTARNLVTAAVDYAADHHWQVYAAVCDPFGHPVALARTDMAAPPVADYALDKAYTAAVSGNTTQAYFARMSGDPQLALGLGNRARVSVWPGGVPIYADGSVIGGLGVSGAAGPDDVACACHALAQFGLVTDPHLL